MKLLHLMYSGSHKGGVQRWAKLLRDPGGTKIIHSSFKKGTIAEDFKKDGVRYEKLSLQLVRSSDILVLSDLRSIIFGAILNFASKRKKTAFFVIHTNIRKLFDIPFLVVASFAFNNVTLVLTTQEQRRVFGRYFQKKEIINLFESLSPDSFEHTGFNQNKNVMYFGKLSYLKEVPLYLRSTKSLKGRVAFIFGEGHTQVVEEIKKYKNLVNFKPGWHEMSKVVIEHKIGFLVVPCKGEGISLATVEAVSFGLIPICKQESAFSTLGLPDIVKWKENQSLNNVILSIETFGQDKVYTECRKAVQKYLKRTKKLSDLLLESKI